jgi:hypothetical protein
VASHPLQEKQFPYPLMFFDKLLSEMKKSNEGQAWWLRPVSTQEV